MLKKLLFIVFNHGIKIQSIVIQYFAKFRLCLFYGYFMVFSWLYTVNWQSIFYIEKKYIK